MSFARPIVRDLRRRDIAAAEAQVAFAWDRPLFDPVDLAVFVKAATAVEFTRVDPAAYDITLGAGFASATVTFDAPPRPAMAAALVVRLEGRRIQERLADVTRGGTVNSAAIEDEFDRQAVILQEVRRDLDDYAQFLALLAAQVAAAGPLMPVGAMTQFQFREGLQSLGLLYDFDASLPGSPTDPLRRQWNGPFVHSGGSLWAAAKTFLGYSDAQMALFYAACVGYAQ